MTCPELGDLLERTHGPDTTAHVRNCEACRAVLALGNQREARALTCDEIEPLFAAWAVNSLGDGDQVAVTRHLQTCDACMELARDLETSTVAEALFELGGVPGADFAELRTVDADNYVRGGEIGRGGMGRIVRARDRRLGRSVAIKELLNAKMKERFEREARLTARLQHPAIVNVHEAGCWPSGEPFYVMKYVSGRPLDQIVAEKKSAAERFALLPHVIAVVDAVAYAHSERVIHRDLKPSNVLVGAFGETVVIDWGLAKDLGEPETDMQPYRDMTASALTAAGAGTPLYMPPEQAAGAPPDERVDVYALGATLYHVLAGHAPFKGVASAADLATERVAGAKPIDKVVREVPPELAAIVMKAMSPEPAARYATAGQLAEELKRFAAGQLVQAHAYTYVQRVSRFARRNRAAVSVAAAASLLLAGGGGIAVHRIIAERHTAVYQRDRAEQTLADVYAEHGRQELEAGHPSQALIYLDAALQNGARAPNLRTYIAQAAVPIDSLVAALPGQGSGSHVFGFSPDGERLVSGADDGTTRVYSTSTGEVRLTLPGEGLPVWIARFSPDGGRIVTATTVLRVWDAHDGRSLLTIYPPHDQSPDAVLDVRFSPDGQSILMVMGRRAWVWDASSGAFRFQIEHKDLVHGAAYDAAGARIVTASADGTAQICDARTGATLFVLTAGKGLAGAAFSPDGSRVVTAGWDGKARIWNAATGADELTVVTGEFALASAAFASDGESIVTLAQKGDSAAHVWDAHSGAPIATLDHSAQVNSVTISPTGEIVTASADGSVRLWTALHTRLAIFDGAEEPFHFAASSDDGRIVAGISDGGAIRIWRAGTEVRGEPSGLHYVLETRGDLVLGYTPEWELAVYDVKARRIIAHSKELGPPNADGPEMNFFYGRGIDPVARRILMSHMRLGLVAWDLNTGEVRRLDPGISHVSPTGDRAITSTGRVLDADGHELGKIGGLDDYPTWSSDGTRFAMMRGRTVSTYASETVTMGPALEQGSPGTPVQTALSPNGDLVAVRTFEGVVRLWRSADGKLLGDVQIADIQSIAFSGDSSSIVAVGQSRITELDAKDLRRRSVARPRYEIVASEVSHGGRLILLHDLNRSLVWDLETHQSIAEVASGGDATFSGDDRSVLVDGKWRSIAPDERSAAEIHRLTSRVVSF